MPEVIFTAKILLTSAYFTGIQFRGLIPMASRLSLSFSSNLSPFFSPKL